jgi:hypothetical protein
MDGREGPWRDEFVDSMGRCPNWTSSGIHVLWVKVPSESDGRHRDKRAGKMGRK